MNKKEPLPLIDHLEPEARRALWRAAMHIRQASEGSCGGAMPVFVRLNHAFRKAMEALEQKAPTPETEKAAHSFMKAAVRLTEEVLAPRLMDDAATAAAIELRAKLACDTGIKMPFRHPAQVVGVMQN